MRRRCWAGRLGPKSTWAPGSELRSRERTDTGIRFRFGVRDGLADEVRDLAAREKACCAFFDFDVREHGDEITWDASVVDDPIARQILDEYYALPDTLDGSVADLFDRDRAIGELSFPLYIVHHLVMMLLKPYFWSHTELMDWFGWCTLGISLHLSFLLWVGVMRPIDRWRARRVERKLGG